MPKGQLFACLPYQRLMGYEYAMKFTNTFDWWNGKYVSHPQLRFTTSSPTSTTNTFYFLYIMACIFNAWSSFERNCYLKRCVQNKKDR